jgi:hypothetical protein
MRSHDGPVPAAARGHVSRYVDWYAANGLARDFVLALRGSAQSRAVVFAFASGLNLRLGLGRLLRFAFSSIFVSHALSLSRGRR